MNGLNLIVFRKSKPSNRILVLEKKTIDDTHCIIDGQFYGAGDRTRTGTLSPAVDFESTTSTNSITPAGVRIHFYVADCFI